MLDAATSRGLAVDRSGLPDGVRKLLDLAVAVPERDTKRAAASPSLLARVGAAAMSEMAGAREMITFVGEASLLSPTPPLAARASAASICCSTFRKRGRARSASCR